MSADVITYLLNGDLRTAVPGATVADVVSALGSGTAGIAVACNGTLVPRSCWAETEITPGDRFEIVTIAAGG